MENTQKWEKKIRNQANIHNTINLFWGCQKMFTQAKALVRNIHYIVTDSGLAKVKVQYF